MDTWPDKLPGDVVAVTTGESFTAAVTVVLMNTANGICFGGLSGAAASGGCPTAPRLVRSAEFLPQRLRV